jgi:hypothetical protein
MKKLLSYILIVTLSNYLTIQPIVTVAKPFSPSNTTDASHTPKPLTPPTTKPLTPPVAVAKVLTPPVVAPKVLTPPVATKTVVVKPATSKPAIIHPAVATPAVAVPAVTTPKTTPVTKTAKTSTTTPLSVSIGYPFIITNRSTQSITTASFTFAYTTSDKPGVTQKIDIVKDVTLPAQKTTSVPFDSFPVPSASATVSGTFNGLYAIKLSNNQTIDMSSSPSFGAHPIYINNINGTWSISSQKAKQSKTALATSKNAVIKAGAASKAATALAKK